MKIVLRLPPEMHHRLDEAADSHAAYVSLNSEIVRRLFATLTDDDKKRVSLGDAVERLQDTVDAMRTDDLLTLDGKIIDALNKRSDALHRSRKRGKK